MIKIFSSKEKEDPVAPLKELMWVSKGGT